jgi:hypothetical protein
MTDKREQHAFSIELNRKEALKKVNVSDDDASRVVIEGFLGELVGVCLVEDSLLEIQGVNGIFRIDISRDELAKLLKSINVETKK